MKTIFTIALLTASLFSSVRADEFGDVFNTGNREFKFEKFSNEGILLALENDAKLACSTDGQCILSSMKSDSNGWETSFNFGQGIMGNNGSGTTIYTSGSSNNYGNPGALNWEITVAYKVSHCTQTVMVPKSLFYALNRYMYGLMQDTGDTKKGFTPADESMIIFYSTIAKQATGCSTNK